ncbi:sigma factor [Nocardioides sp. Soil777]|uniref:sigma factor n=1 Tax=Nocardioides sp. Soil777 TaxID=1736409 RepID=UPI00138EE539|nr:sigma factor [Nocardioides sp. Soil777]
MRDLDRLLVAAGRSDTAAFAELYDALAPRVLGLALQVLGEPRRAEEVAEAAFLEMWRTAPHFDPTQGSALARAMATTHRRAVDRLRSDAPMGRGRGDQSSTPSLRTALAQLPDVRREAVELAYCDGRTHTEVGLLTQAPSGAAAARMRDGLAQLRDLLMAPVVETA